MHFLNNFSDPDSTFFKIILLTLKLFKFSTTQPSNASRPIVTVMFGIGSANRGRPISEKKTKMI